MNVKKLARHILPLLKIIPPLFFLLISAGGCVTLPRAQRLYVPHQDYIASASDIRIVVIDVGQGDSIFIKTPNKKYILVDAGGVPSWKGGGVDTGRDYVMPVLERNMPYNAPLDAVVMTHPHADHVGGMASILKDMKVKKVYDSGYARGDKEYADCLDVIKRKDIPYEIVSDGDELEIDPDVSIKVLSPPSGFYYEDANNNSVVLRLKYKDFTILLTGDAEMEAENYIVSRHPKSEISSNVLKSPHHGSRSSSSPSFIAACQPEVAVISCGRNNQFGHPHSETISRYRSIEAAVYRTDYDGDVTIVSNGFNFTVIPSRRGKR